MSDEPIFWYYRTHNQSPRVTAAFLARQRGLLTAGQYAREHENQWVDAADSYTTAADVDWAMARYARVHPSPPLRGLPNLGYVYRVDLGLVHDATVIALGHLTGPDAIIDRIETLQGTKRDPVKISHVRRTLEVLMADFPPALVTVESWQGVALAEQLGETWPVEVVTPTVALNREEWGLLLARLTERTLVLPPHARLREELLGLVVEVGPTGARVVDRGKVHQDHAIAVRGVIASLAPWTVPVDPRRYEPDAYDRGVADSWARFSGAPLAGEVIDTETAEGFSHEDMRWSRVGPDGVRRPLW